MSHNKNMIFVLMVFMLILCIGTVSANEDSSNITLNSDNIDDIVTSEVNDELLGDEEDTTIYVDSSFEGDEQGTNENPYKTISGAINSATGNKTIIFIKNGSYSENSITLSDSMGFSFVGESETGVVITTTADSRVYFLNANLNNTNLSLINLTFKNSYRGEGFNITGSGYLEVINCTFDKFMDTSAITAVFAIFNTNSTIRDSKIINSDSRQSGNGFIRYGEGNHIIENVIIKDSVDDISPFSEGFIRVDENAIVDANNLTIVNFKAPSNKGIIQVAGKFNIKNSIFINNTVYGTNLITPYSLFYVNGGNLTIESSLISNNGGFNYLIYENGENSITNLNYNAILNNTYVDNLVHSAGNTNLNYNWWNTNDKPNSFVDNWIIMGVTVNQDGNNVIVVVNFNKSSDGNEIEKYLPNAIKVKFESFNDTLNTIENIKENIAQATFISNGDFFVKISSGLANIILPIKISYVDSNFDGEELGTFSNPYKTISKAIDESNNWETIFIKNGIYYVDNPIILFNSLNIVGESEEGVVISGSNKGIFSTPSYMSNNIVVSFTNLTIKDIVCTGNNVVLTIGNNISNLNIVNCTFDNCSGKFGVMNINNSNTYITNSKIYNSGNILSDGIGVSAIYFAGDGNYELDNVIISNIKSISNNDAIVCVIYSSGTLDIKNSRIENNSFVRYENLMNTIFYAGDNASICVEQCFILNNSGIDNLAYGDINSNISMNYNVILNNEYIDAINSTVYNLDYNWWGNNNKSNDYVNNWVIMDVNIIKGYDTVVYVDFNKFTDGENTFDLEKYLPDGIEVKSQSSQTSVVDVNYTKNNQVTFSFVVGASAYSVNISSSSVVINLILENNNYIYVNGAFDGEENGTEEAPFKTISAAINNATSGSIIYIKNGTYSGLGVTSFDKNIILVGESQDGCIITITSTLTLTLNEMSLSVINLTFKASGNAVGLSFRGNGNLNMENCVLNGFGSRGSEGTALGFATITSYIKDCSIFGASFTAPRNAYFISYTGSGVHVIKNLKIDNIKNTVTTTRTYLNSIISVGSSCSVDIDNLSISNSSGIMDALIYNNGALNIVNSLIQDNTISNANSRGFGLIYNNGGNLNVTSSVILDNTGFNYLIYDNNGVNSIGYNIIYNNKYNTAMVRTTTVVNLDYNWWGTNDPDVVVNSWIILTADFDDDNIMVGDEINVIASLTKYITTDGVVGELIQNTPEIQISFTLPNKTVIDVVTENGKAVMPYTTNLTDKNIIVTLNDAKITLSIPFTLRIDVGELVVGEENNITIVAPGATGNVTIIVDGKKEIIKFENGNAIVIIDKLTFGNHSVIVNYDGDENYNDILKYEIFNIDALDSELNASVENISVGDVAEINISVVEDATGYVLVEIDGNIYYAKIESGNAVVSVSDLTADTKNIIITYSGDDKYGGSVFETSFNVSKVVSSIDIDTSDIVFGDGGYIYISLPSDATGDVTLIIDNNTIDTVSLDEGSASIYVSDLTSGLHNVNVSYSGDDKYNETMGVATLDLVYNILINGDSKLGENATIVMELPSDATGNITLTINNNTYNTTVVDGYATIVVSGLTFGQHNVNVSYSGNGKYEALTVNGTINVYPNIVIPEDIVYNDDSKISILLPGDGEGNLTVIIDDNITIVAVVNGSGSMDLSSLSPGSHEVNVSFEGNYEVGTVESIVHVSTNVNIPEEISENDNITICLPDDASGNLTVIVDGKVYTNTPLVNGSASVGLSNLSVGSHEIEVEYTGDDKYSYQSIMDVNVKKSTPQITIRTPSNATIGDSVNLIIQTPKDATGIVLLRINNNNYFININNETTVFAVPAILVGNNNVIFEYLGDSKYENVDGNVSFYVLPKPVIKASNLVVLYTSNSKYTVQLTQDGKVLSNKLVVITINGKVNKVTTDSNGYASVNVDLAPKTYTATAEYGGVKTTSKVTVNSILSASNLNVKKSAKSLNIKVTLKKVDNKYLSSKQITLKFNGKTYKTKTNSKGIVTFKIAKNIIKKLKVGKKYNYQVTYGKDTIAKSISVKK